MTSLKEKLIKIGAKVVSHGRYVTFQMAEVGAPRRREEGRPLGLGFAGSGSKPPQAAPE
jgi:hypothetical protein